MMTATPTRPQQGTQGSILLVDDEPLVLKAYKRGLEAAGNQVVTAPGAQAALQLIAQGAAFDVVISDLNMPGLSGTELLIAVRDHDRDVPVVLMSAAPTLPSALEAVEHGAFLYLTKPVAIALLCETVERARRLHLLARLKREAIGMSSAGDRGLGDLATLEQRFEGGLDGLWMAYQPIVKWRERRLHAYEALVRTSEPTLANPVELLLAAERLGRSHGLGRHIRAAVARMQPSMPSGTDLFVNLLPSDLLDEQLYDPAAPLSKIAHWSVLEITERESLESIADLHDRRRALRALGFRVAVDDLGAGYAGLDHLIQLEPDVVKLDMALVRGIDSQKVKQNVVRSMVSLCEELRIQVVSEGVETAAERDALELMGSHFQQGYLFARPGRALPLPKW